MGEIIHMNMSQLAGNNAAIERIPYKGYVITMTHRPETNDYVYRFEIPVPFTGMSARRAHALRDAKKRIDNLVQERRRAK